MKYLILQFFSNIFFSLPEHFLDTEYDKAKTGHEKTNGLKEHESHNDHDSHENKKLHTAEESSGHKLHTGSSVGKAAEEEEIGEFAFTISYQKEEMLGFWISELVLSRLL